MPSLIQWTVKHFFPALVVVALINVMICGGMLILAHKACEPPVALRSHLTPSQQIAEASRSVVPAILLKAPGSPVLDDLLTHRNNHNRPGTNTGHKTVSGLACCDAGGLTL